MGLRKRAKRNGCDGKQRHETRTEASAHLASLIRDFGYKGSVYRCSFCHFWHVGRHHKRRFA